MIKIDFYIRDYSRSFGDNILHKQMEFMSVPRKDEYVVFQSGWGCARVIDIINAPTYIEITLDMNLSNDNWQNLKELGWSN
jgi:hypothetical protein